MNILLVVIFGKQYTYEIYKKMIYIQPDLYQDIALEVFNALARIYFKNYEPHFGKRDLMHERKVLSHISLCSPHRLIKDETIRFYCIFV